MIFKGFRSTMQMTVDIHEMLRQTLIVTVKVGGPSLLASLCAGVVVYSTLYTYGRTIFDQMILVGGS